MASGAEIKAVSVWASVTHTDLDLGVRQAARLPLATQRAAQKMRMLQSSTEAEALVRASQRAPTVAQRIVWLHKAATAWGKPVEAVAACAKGCAHCCHIPVTISGKEAQLVSRATGRAAVATPRNSVSVQDLTEVDTVALASEKLTHWGTGTACPFLVSDTCSIYEIRPLACRVLFNMMTTICYAGMARSSRPMCLMRIRACCVHWHWPPSLRRRSPTFAISFQRHPHPERGDTQGC
jgi:Fe-S-cluster containining protein